MLVFQRWTVRQLDINIPELAFLWNKLQEYPTLFSDATRGDIRNWISLVQDPSTVWFQIFDEKELVGLVYLEQQQDDANVHIVFFDRKPAEKKDLCRHIAKLIFDSWPNLHRLTAEVPDIYYSTWRLAQKIGFHWEGTKRESVVIGGQRRGVHLYSLLRGEVQQWGS
jgi:RimJ/RimL family protein N-acetyltransferase